VTRKLSGVFVVRFRAPLPRLSSTFIDKYEEHFLDKSRGVGSAGWRKELGYRLGIFAARP
jgi:hypothetical protein